MEIQIIPYAPAFPAKGSQLLKEFGSIGTPILDSLVRESVQNSLDARVVGKNVVMNFNTGVFKKKLLFAQCDRLEEFLSSSFPDIPNNFLSFRDYNTQGLTGAVVDMGDQNTGNYFRLVRDIGNEQSNAGAGGSCGIGKSLYFRLGIKGFVIYYSRIKSGEGAFESRLIAMMVENERANDSVIPPAIKGRSKTGIAYWGKLDRENNILPVTNEKEIQVVLDIFNVAPYKGEETGTAVILPFIDENRLLKYNEYNYEENGQTFVPVWQNSIGEFLKYSVQRWYFSRLNNIKYQYGSSLSVNINNQPLTLSEMAPCFKVFQALYNRAAGCKEEDLDDVLSGKEVVIQDIELPRYRPLEKKKTGTIAYLQADKELLGMLPPNNKYSPYIYCNTPVRDNDANTPIIGYCRRPGMIVNYETAGEWLYRVPSTDLDHFLLVIFVLNSKNKFSDTYLEEYVRKMEPNDHMKWVDGIFEDSNYSFISNTQRKVSLLLCKYLSGNEQVESKRKMSELGKIFSWILPPEDFGRKPNSRPSTSGSGSSSSRHAHKIKYNIESQVFDGESLDIIYSLETTQKKSGFNMELLVSATEGKNITLDEWGKMGAELPFFISTAFVSIKKIEGKSCSKMFPLTNDKSKHEEKQLGLNLELKKAGSTPVPYLLECEFKSECTFKIEVRLNIHITSRSALPNISIV